MKALKVKVYAAGLKTPHHGGVVGVNTAGGFGVYGQSDDGIGVVGESKTSEGVRGVSHNSRGGVVGVNDWAPADPPGAGGNGGWLKALKVKVCAAGLRPLTMVALSV